MKYKKAESLLSSGEWVIVNEYYFRFNLII
ncbi:hypothetical protein H4V97_000995 [Flavobacterium sp. CG_23.5]|nr:hypothetical protein [Flavobacterium sp. CG_9.10]MBP2282677.1 hypothetical protein [Flavobacterium sp. CG_23.5]